MAARELKYLVNFVFSIISAATLSLVALPFLSAATDAGETIATSM